jgi:hypothetical protein
MPQLAICSTRRSGPTSSGGIVEIPASPSDTST